MSCLVAFHYRSYGTFFYTQKGSIISTVVLPTTEIIEPKKTSSLLLVLLGIILFVSLVLEFNWQYGIAFVVAISYAMLWNLLHIQFLRKYYFGSGKELD